MLFISQPKLKVNPTVVLITGVCGFIGSSLARKILCTKTEDICVGIDKIDPRKENCHQVVSKRFVELEKLKTNGNYVFEKVDITDISSLQEVVEKYRPVKIVHFAGLSGVRSSNKNPEEYKKNNVEGTRNMLKVAAQYHVKKFVFASSSSVYGDLVKFPTPEDASVVANKLKSVYAQTKQRCEELCKEFSEKYSTKVFVMRFFTVYGEYGRNNMVVWIFTEGILTQREVTVYRPEMGEMSRDFTYVGDVVRAVLAAMEKNDLETNFEVLNVGSGKSVKLSTLLKTIERECGMKAVKTEKEQPKEDVLKTHADIRYARKVIGYHPEVQIDEGIHRFVKWFKNELLSKKIK